MHPTGKTPQYVATLRSIQDEVSLTVSQVENWLLKKRVSADYLGNVALVLAEALNNIIEHACAYSKDMQIAVKIWMDRTGVMLKLVDNGREMDNLPVKKEMNGHLVGLDDLPEGGFGWFLIYSLSEEISYTRTKDRNELFIRVPSRDQHCVM